MRLPKDIKRALGCGTTFYSCKECAYNIDNCGDEVEMDALKYIEQLESRLAQVEKERDAAIHDCAMFPCQTCVDREHGDLCVTCRVENYRRSNYEWRGVCEEE